MPKKCQNKHKPKGIGVIIISTNFNTGNFDAFKSYESTEVDRRTWKFDEEAYNGLVFVEFTRLFPYTCSSIVTLTFDLNQQGSSSHHG